MPHEQTGQPPDAGPVLPGQQERSQHWQGTVAEGIDGDGREDGQRKKGRIPLRRVRVDGPNGLALRFGQHPAPDSVPVRVRAMRSIGFHRFDACPICLAPDPGTREHVPPASLGGAVATFVCSRCNNELGSRIEFDLLDWRDDALRSARVSGGTVPGRRRLERLLRRSTADGAFVLVPDGRVDPTFRDILASREFQLRFTPPEPGKPRRAQARLSRRLS